MRNISDFYCIFASLMELKLLENFVKMGKKIATSGTLIFLILFAFYGLAETADWKQTMQNANDAYQKQDYATAVTLYQQIADAGNEGSILYYNLGNAYYKNGNSAKALLYYERALRLDPRNEDIKHNIAFVNQKLIDKIDALPEIFITRWWNALSQSLTSNGWAIFSIVCSALIFILLAVILLVKNQLTKSITLIVTIICAIILIFSVIFSSKEKNRYMKEPEAIVMDLVLNVKSSPDSKSGDLFVIHEGLKVAITDRVNEWVEIRLPNGDKGWVKAQSVEEI